MKPCIMCEGSNLVETPALTWCADCGAHQPEAFNWREMAARVLSPPVALMGFLYGYLVLFLLIDEHGVEHRKPAP